ncbi:MAG: hypothetical protein P1V97_03375, partial [Planctomycetota bacterium]|nr:hypothetical protein [Planctomycetota bacterium]
MKLTWKDFLTARALYQQGLLAFSAISAELQTYESLEQGDSWLEHLCQKQLLKQTDIPGLYAQVSKFEFLRAEAHYSHAAKKQGVAPHVLKKAQDQQIEDSYQQRLSHYIVRAHPLSEDQQSQILNSARESFNAHTLQLLQLARDKFMKAPKQRPSRPSARFFKKQSPAQLSKAYGLDQAIFNPTASKAAPAPDTPDKKERPGSGSWSQEAFTQLNNKLKEAQKSKTSDSSHGSWGSNKAPQNPRKYKVKTKEQRLL